MYTIDTLRPVIVCAGKRNLSFKMSHIQCISTGFITNRCSFWTHHCPFLTHLCSFKCKVSKTFEVQTYFPSHYNQNERQPIMTANLSCFFPNFPFGEKLWVIMIEQVGEDSAVGKGNGEVEDRDGREAGNDESNPPQHQIYFLAHRRIRLYVVWRGVFKNFTRSRFQKS